MLGYSVCIGVFIGFLTLDQASAQDQACPPVETDKDCGRPIEYLGGNQQGCDCFSCNTGLDEQWVLCTKNSKLKNVLGRDTPLEAEQVHLLMEADPGKEIRIEAEEKENEDRRR